MREKWEAQRDIVKKTLRWLRTQRTKSKAVPRPGANERYRAFGESVEYLERILKDIQHNLDTVVEEESE